MEGQTSLTEADLVDEVRRYLAERGVKTWGEVPCFDRSIDFVYLNPFTAVEAKLADWRGGLIQAQRHNLAIDYGYVLLPRRNVTDKMRKAFDFKGIGLYLWDGSLMEAIKPRRSTEIWEPARERVLKALEEVERVENGR